MVPVLDFVEHNVRVKGVDACFSEGASNSAGFERENPASLDKAEKLELADVGDAAADDAVDCLAVIVFIRLKADYIKRLKKVGGMRREPEDYNLMLEAEIEEFVGVVGAVAIKEKEALRPYLLVPCFLLKMPQPVHAELVIRISRFGDPDNGLRMQLMVMVIPLAKVDLALQDQERRYDLPRSRDALYCYGRLAIRRHCKEPLMLAPCDAELALANAYHKASLVHVPHISRPDAVLFDNPAEPLKPATDHGRVLRSRPGRIKELL